jgi:hypothetical protein
MKNYLKLLLMTLVVFQISCTETTVEEVVTEATNEEVKAIINHHLGSFGENNMEEVLKDYTEESIIITPDAEFKGLTAIEGFFLPLFDLFPAGAAEVAVDVMKAEGGVGFITWHGSSEFVIVPLGTDTFVIKNGKIHRQTFAGIINPVEKEGATE